MYTNFWGGKTHLIKQDSIPFYNWYQHHYYQLYHDCFNFGHSVQSTVLVLRVSNGFADVIGPVEFGRRNSSYVDLKLAINQMKQQRKWGEIKITYHSGAHGCED